MYGRLAEADCGVKSGDQVPEIDINGYYACSAVITTTAIGLAYLDELGVPDERRTQVVSHINSVECQTNRGLLGEDYDVITRCPLRTIEIVHEIEEWGDADYSEADLRTLARSYHPAFRGIAQDVIKGILARRRNTQ